MFFHFSRHRQSNLFQGGCFFKYEDKNCPSGCVVVLHEMPSKNGCPQLLNSIKSTIATVCCDIQQVTKVGLQPCVRCSANRSLWWESCLSQCFYVCCVRHITWMKYYHHRPVVWSCVIIIYEVKYNKTELLWDSYRICFCVSVCVCVRVCVFLIITEFVFQEFSWVIVFTFV